MPINVNMLGLAFASDCHIRSKNGEPHQSTTGVARTSPIQLIDATEMRRPTAPPESMSPIDSRNTGAPSATPIQKRRVMSTSSGFGAATFESADLHDRGVLHRRLAGGGKKSLWIGGKFREAAVRAEVVGRAPVLE